MAKAFYETEWFRQAGKLPPADRLKFWDAVSAWAVDEPVPDPKGPSRLLILQALSQLQADRNHRRTVSEKRSAIGKIGVRNRENLRSARTAAMANAPEAIASDAIASPADAIASDAIASPADAIASHAIASPGRIPETPESVENQREDALLTTVPDHAIASDAIASSAPAPRNNNNTKSIVYPLKVIPEGNGDNSQACIQTRMEGLPGMGTEDARARELPVIGIPLNDGGKYGVTREELEQYEQLYPAVDVMQELRNMVGWCEADPRRRKTRSGAKRFVNGWLMKAQNRGGQGLPSRQAPFNPYRQFVKGDVFNDL